MFYERVSAGRLPSNSGMIRPDGTRVSTGEEGCLTFGPYATLPAGAYTSGFYLRLDETAPDDGVVTLEAAYDIDRTAAARNVPISRLSRHETKFVSLNFDLHRATKDFEMRLVCHEVHGLVVEELVIFRRTDEAPTKTPVVPPARLPEAAVWIFNHLNSQLG